MLEAGSAENGERLSPLFVGGQRLSGTTSEPLTENTHYGFKPDPFPPRLWVTRPVRSVFGEHETP